MKSILCLCSGLILLAGCGAEATVKTVELPYRAVQAYPELRVRRPVVMTHANDGSGRLFIVTQQGVIHFIDAADKTTAATNTFLDIESQVAYKDHENEEGLLGLAFHPSYVQTGEFYVYYTLKDPPHTSVVSRFRVRADDPNRADPDSEEELLRIEQPYWNHNGGNLAFGPDGCLYIGLGDGGSANDPQGNGQNLETLLGSILRIDVDQRSENQPYGIPKDNPYVNHESAHSEIWAFGLRNVWGMSFDRETGLLWAADVGQNIWEEINLIERGGNYGWNLREGKHPFRAEGSPPSKDLIEPIWEYHHDEGKSITGGVVYRGERLSELRGYYLFADYVTGKLWALKYDAERNVVTEHARLESYNNAPIVAFGEDERGEVYLSDSFGNLYRLERIEAPLP